MQGVSNLNALPKNTIARQPLGHLTTSTTTAQTHKTELQRDSRGLSEVVEGDGVKLGHLIEARGKQVEGGHNAAVGPEAVLFHHLLVVDRVSDV